MKRVMLRLSGFSWTMEQMQMLKASDGLNVAFEKGHTDCRASFGQEKLGQKTQLHI